MVKVRFFPCKRTLLTVEFGTPLAVSKVPCSLPSFGSSFSNQGVKVPPCSKKDTFQLPLSPFSPAWAAGAASQRPVRTTHTVRITSCLSLNEENARGGSQNASATLQTFQPPASYVTS